MVKRYKQKIKTTSNLWWRQYDFVGKDGVIPSPINFVGEEGRYAEDIRKQNENGETILHEAVRRADKDMVEWLMLVDSKLALVPMEGTSPLYLAVSLGYHDIATMIHTQSNGFVSYSGPNGQNVLHASVLRSEGIVCVSPLIFYILDLGQKLFYE